MASNLTFAPVANFDSGVTDFIDQAKLLARSLKGYSLPAMLIRRDPEDDLDRTNRISDAVLRHEILPVVQFYTTDESSQLRNLHESAVLGSLDLIWQDGEPVYEIADLLEFLLETWKTRVPIDINLYFKGRLPKYVAIQNIGRMIKSVMERNRHVQVVKLAEIPEIQNDNDSLNEARRIWDVLLDSCPGAEPALSPELWAKHDVLREGIYDFGLIDFECLEPYVEAYMSEELKLADCVAAIDGLQLLPRLPLTITFYKRSWFAIDIGKVLSHWADKKNYKAYMERPQADPKYTRRRPFDS